MFTRKRLLILKRALYSGQVFAATKYHEFSQLSTRQEIAPMPNRLCLDRGRQNTKGAIVSNLCQERLGYFFLNSLVSKGVWIDGWIDRLSVPYQQPVNIHLRYFCTKIIEK